MIHLSHSSRAAAIGAFALTAVVAVAGCGSGSSGSGSGSGSGTSQSSSFRLCLQKHGVTLPSGGRPPGAGSGGTSAPHPRPTGSAASAFRKAIQACGGSFGGGSFGGGGGG